MKLAWLCLVRLMIVPGRAEPRQLGVASLGSVHVESCGPFSRRAVLDPGGSCGPLSRRCAVLDPGAVAVPCPGGVRCRARGQLRSLLSVCGARARRRGGRCGRAAQRRWLRRSRGFPCPSARGPMAAGPREMRVTRQPCTTHG